MGAARALALREPTRIEGPEMTDLQRDVYERIFGEVAALIDESRRLAARSINAVMTATYWLIGRYIVQHEQAGGDRSAH